MKRREGEGAEIPLSCASRRKGGSGGIEGGGGGVGGWEKFCEDLHEFSCNSFGMKGPKL